MAAACAIRFPLHEHYAFCRSKSSIAPYWRHGFEARFKVREMSYSEFKVFART
jgi:hypothetical protein